MRMRIGSRRAFTLIELVVVMVVAAVLASISLIGYTTVRENIADSSTEQQLLALVPAQAQTYSSVGSFASSPQTAAPLYTDPPYFLSGDTEAESVGEVSLAAAVLPGDGFDVIAYATRSDTGNCVALVQYEPDARTDPLTVPVAGATICDAETVLEGIGATDVVVTFVTPYATGFEAVAGPGMVTVRWVQSPGAVYTLQVECLTADQCPTREISPIVTNSYVDTPLISGVTYKYTLLTQNPTGGVSSSGTIYATPF